MSDSHHEPAHADHGHDAHATDHGHDDHGHGHHGGHNPWVDYNAKDPAPSTLPPLSAPVLAAFGLILAVVLALIVNTSLQLGAHASHAEKSEEHAKAGAEAESHQPEKAH